MARRARRLPQAVRELCLAFPDVEEFESHGAPNFRARRGKVFAIWALNHHGDGHAALWLNTPAAEQSRLIASAPKHVFKPPYVGPSGWIGVELNRGFPWRRAIELTHLAYLYSTPRTRSAAAVTLPVVAPPAVKMAPAEIDRLKAPAAQKLWARLRRICLALPQTREATSFGSPVWQVGKKTFAVLADGKRLRVSFWVGIERQGPLILDPRFDIPAFTGHRGWIALDVAGGVRDAELREWLLDSYRHFAPRRALAQLEAGETG